MTVDGLQDRLPGPKVAEIVAHDVHVVALGIERGDAPLGALLAVVAVVVVGADVRDLVLAEDADEAAGEGRLARRRVADDAEYGGPGHRYRSLWSSVGAKRYDRPSSIRSPIRTSSSTVKSGNSMWWATRDCMPGFEPKKSSIRSS